LYGCRAAPGSQPDQIPSLRADPLGQRGVHLDHGFSFGVGQRGDPRGLRAGLVLAQQPTRGQVVRVFGVGQFGGSLLFDGMELGTAIPRREVLGEQARRAGMPRRGVRPKHPLLSGDSLVADPRVVSLSVDQIHHTENPMCSDRIEKIRLRRATCLPAASEKASSSGRQSVIHRDWAENSGEGIPRCTVAVVIADLFKFTLISRQARHPTFPPR
jgi:hypothetical protein